MKNEYLYNLLKEQVGSVVKRVAKNLSKLSLEDLIKSEKSLQSKIGKLSKAGGSDEELKLAKDELKAVQKQKLKLDQGAGVSGDVPAKSAAARVADEEAAAETKVAAKAAEEAKPAATFAADTSDAGKGGKEAKELPKVKKPDFSNPQSQEIADRIQGLKKAGATEEEIKPLRDQLLRNEGIATQEVDDISKRLQKLQSDYETTVKTGGEDSPRAKAIKNQMEKLNGVTTFTKIKRFCTGSYKKGGLCLAVLGATGYGAYKLVDSLITPAPAPNPTPKPGPGGGGGGGGRKCGSTLKSGCKGENVKSLQQKLLDCGEKLPRKGVDGFFGPETKAAVRSFQDSHKLTVDGIAGKDTLDALGSCRKSNASSEKDTGEEKTYPSEESGSNVNSDTQSATTAPASATTKETTGKLKSTPYWMTNKWADVKDSRNSAEKEKVKQELISKGYADETNWEERKSKGVPMQESKIQKNYFLKTISDRHERVEKLVFERLIKNAS